MEKPQFFDEPAAIERNIIFMNRGHALVKKDYHCIENECYIRATYGMPGRKAQYCKHHSNYKMVNVVHYKICKVRNCIRKAVNNLFCDDHSFIYYANPSECSSLRTLSAVCSLEFQKIQ